MAETLQPLEPGTDLNQVLRFHSRERRRSLAGIPEMHVSRIQSGKPVSLSLVALIAAEFPAAVRAAPVTVRTAIRILDNGGVHRGNIFELGNSGGQISGWVGDQTIGLRAGGLPGSGDEVAIVYDNGSELPPGAEIELVFAVNPGNGKARIWGNGRELARGQATNGTLGGAWCNANLGAFLSGYLGAISTDIPAASRIAPNGFQGMMPLVWYYGQLPRHFV